MVDLIFFLRSFRRPRGIASRTLAPEPVFRVFPPLSDSAVGTMDTSRVVLICLSLLRTWCEDRHTETALGGGGVVVTATRLAAGCSARSGCTVRQCLVRAIDHGWPTVVPAWSMQAHRALTAAGWSGRMVCAARLAVESSKLLRQVARGLARDTEEAGRHDANAQYDLLSADAAGNAATIAQAWALLQLHRSLIDSVWALLLPAMSHDLSGEEIVRARNAFSKAMRHSLGFTANRAVRGTFCNEEGT